MTKQQKANLALLSKYLKRRKLKAKFDMGTFTYHQEDEEGDYSHLRTDCGLVGCAIGHGPYAGIEKFMHEDWFTYSERLVS